MTATRQLTGALGCNRSHFVARLDRKGVGYAAVDKSSSMKSVRAASADSRSLEREQARAAKPATVAYGRHGGYQPQ